MIARDPGATYRACVAQRQPMPVYAQVWDLGFPEGDENRQVLWEGGITVYEQPDDLITMIMPYAPPFDREKLKAQLLDDRLNDSGDIYCLVDVDRNYVDPTEGPYGRYYRDDEMTVDGVHCVFDESSSEVSVEGKRAIATTLIQAMELRGWSSGGMSKPNPASKAVFFERMDDGSVLFREATDEDL